MICGMYAMNNMHIINYSIHHTHYAVSFNVNLYYINWSVFISIATAHSQFNIIAGLYIHVCDNQYLYLCIVYSMHIMYMYIIYGMIMMNCVTGSVNIGHLVANLIETTGIHEATIVTIMLHL